MVTVTPDPAQVLVGVKLVMVGWADMSMEERDNHNVTNKSSTGLAEAMNTGVFFVNFLRPEVKLIMFLYFNPLENNKK